MPRGGELGEQGLRHALAARGGADIHALDLGIVGQQRHPGAADWGAVAGGQVEADMRLEDRVQAQPVALFGRVMGGEFGIEFADQRADGIGGGGDEGEVQHGALRQGGRFGVAAGGRAGKWAGEFACDSIGKQLYKIT